MKTELNNNNKKKKVVGEKQVTIHAISALVDETFPWINSIDDDDEDEDETDDSLEFAQINVNFNDIDE